MTLKILKTLLSITKFQSDLIGHMTLISALEEGFQISIDTDDIVDFSSFKKGKLILKKYKVNM